MSGLTPNLPERPARRLCEFRVEKRWLSMSDGVGLAATIFFPLTKERKQQKFPVLLEYLPYRKDDTFYLMDYPCFSYFARNGYIAVKVDIRGTGASEGTVPDREYSDIELADGEEIISQLAALPESNGNVGMFGVSWSAFNSLQMACRRPPALKAIHAVHGSDDLFHDDVHYIDGNLHVDPYHLFINHELALPKSPDYELDDNYFEERFKQTPWILRYFENQVDGEFWSKKSLKQDYSRINIPVYLMSGLLDGYRTATVRMARELSALGLDVRCDIGPWNHSCPDDGEPGPNFEWQDRLLEWFDRYLSEKPVAGEIKNKNNDKDFLLYVRHGHEPDTDIQMIPGYWRNDAIPARQTRQKKYYLTDDGILSLRLDKSKKVSRSTELKYHPISGTMAGVWWGDSTGDMKVDDDHSLLFESTPLQKALQIIGLPKVSLNVISSSRFAKWTVRLEDVGPDGKVSLVTAALCNPAFRDSRLEPSFPPASKAYLLSLDLHFTTWTFRVGHRVRLAVSNAQFPMCWPSPELMSSQILLNKEDSFISLPTVPVNMRKAEELPKPVEKLSPDDAEPLALAKKSLSKEAPFRRFNKTTGDFTYGITTRSAYRISERKFYNYAQSSWHTSVNNPANSSYKGLISTEIMSRSNKTDIKMRLVTSINVVSDKDNFYITFTRTIIQNGKIVKRRRFYKAFKRLFQ